MSTLRDLSLRAGAPMDAALEKEIDRLERLLARTWQVFAAAGVLLGASVGLLIPGGLGWAGAAISAGYLVWFTLLTRLLARPRPPRVLRWAVPIVESTIPWSFLVDVLETQGPVHALGSWLPPLLYASVMVAAVARLRPLAPVLQGITSGVVFPIVYFVLLRPRLDAAALAIPFYGIRLQITRSISLAVGGVFAAMITVGIRSAIGRAEKVVRSQELFGKYRIERKVASGGMGLVYAATYCPEGGFERPVAIKVIHEHLAQQIEFVRGFRNEAELSARLLHPNIVQVFDFGRVEETYFIAMEYVDGITLLELLKRMTRERRSVPERIIAWIGHELLAGLAYSHAGARDGRGALLRVIHRDLCPVNILLSRNGEVKITDYGVAKALRQARASTTATLAGHLAYMAPEQAEGAPLDERVDLFAVGILLWEMLSGRPLFNRGDDGPTLMAVMHDPIILPSTIRADLAPGWDALVSRALERDADRRYQSATEMAAALAAFSPRTACADELGALVIWAGGLAIDPDEATMAPADDDPTRVDPATGSARVAAADR